MSIIKVFEGFVERVEALMKLVESEAVAARNASSARDQLRELKFDLKELLSTDLDYSAEKAIQQALIYLPKLSTRPSSRWHTGLYGAGMDFNYYLSNNRSD